MKTMATKTGGGWGEGIMGTSYTFLLRSSVKGESSESQMRIAVSRASI
jgi:hypothetical protein